MIRMVEDNGKLEELKRKFGNKDNPQDFPQAEQATSAGDIQLPPPTEFDVDLEKLRGPNRTEDLARLMQTVTHAPDGPVLEGAIYHLQDWARRVDGDLIVGLTANPPKNAEQLYQETNHLIKEGFVPNQLNFFNLYKVPGWDFRFMRQDMWQLMYELFKFDTAGIGKYIDGWAVKSRQIANDAPSINRYMLQLIQNQLAKDGQRLREETIGDRTQRRTIYWGRTTIPGVEAGVTLYESGSWRQVSGYPYPGIRELYLGFGSTFMSGVKPLTKEQLTTYSKSIPNSPHS